MHYTPLGPQARVSLPRENGVAYHAQESWVLNETIRVGPPVAVMYFWLSFIPRKTSSSGLPTTRKGITLVSISPSLLLALNGTFISDRTMRSPTRSRALWCWRSNWSRREGSNTQVCNRLTQSESVTDVLSSGGQKVSHLNILTPFLR